MWFVFLISCLVFALITLVVIWIASKVFRSIEKQRRQDEFENEINEKVKNEILNKERK